MLCEMMSEADLAAYWKQHPLKKRFPSASDRAAWKKLSTGIFQKEKIKLYLTVAEELKSKGEPVNLYPVISAESAFAFIRTGDRRSFEGPYFQRRATLSILTLAECIEHKGRFLPEIVEGLWQLISEPYWFVSAHGDYADEDPMPRHDKLRTDLFCCETGATLATVVSLLEDDLKKISPELLRWIKDLVHERIFSVVEKMDSWWLAGNNNWTPWCASNLAATAFTFLPDQPERLAKLIRALMVSCDRFYDNYAPDGGCDEGPGYYHVAGLKLMNFIDWIDFETDHAFQTVFHEEKMRHIAEYIFHVNMTGNWFASMADSSAKIGSFHRGLLYRFAELVESRKMCDFVLSLNEIFPENPASTFGYHQLTEMTSDLFWVPLKFKSAPVARDAFTMLPDLQFFVLRECPEDDRRGSILCIKGGHNAESHNHNDVGQFELFHNGEPILIDMGSSVYTRFTFSERRYESWVHSAVGHNVPVFNGVLQPAGGDYRALLVEAKPGKIVLDLTGAYPSEAGIESYRRTAMLKNGIFSVQDSVAFSSRKKSSVELNLYSAVEPVKVNDSIRLAGVNMKIKGLNLDSVDRIPIDDPNLFRAWGPRVYRISLTGEFTAPAVWTLSWT